MGYMEEKQPQLQAHVIWLQESRRGKLTTAALVLHADVLLVLAGILVEFALVAVVLPVAAAHRLLGSALAAKGAHAFR